MLRCKADKPLIQILQLSSMHPVLNAMSADFFYQDNYVYFSNERIQSKEKLQELIHKGLIELVAD